MTTVRSSQIYFLISRKLFVCIDGLALGHVLCRMLCMRHPIIEACARSKACTVLLLIRYDGGTIGFMFVIALADLMARSNCRTRWQN